MYGVSGSRERVGQMLLLMRWHIVGKEILVLPTGCFRRGNFFVIVEDVSDDREI